MELINKKIIIIIKKKNLMIFHFDSKMFLLLLPKMFFLIRKLKIEILQLNLEFVTRIPKIKMLKMKMNVVEKKKKKNSYLKPNIFLFKLEL